MIYFIEVLIAIAFLLMNSIFVLVEFAIVKVRYTRMEELSQKGNLNAKIALEILKNINSYLASIQLGITMASLALGWIGEPAFAKLIEPIFKLSGIRYLNIYSYTISFAFAFAVISSLHIIVGEQVPKYLAISASERMMLLFAIPLKIFYHITYYPMLVINKSANLITSLFKIKKTEYETTHSEDELRIILSQSEEIGKISLGRLMMFEHLFDFGKTQIKEVMTHKDKIIALDIDISYEDLMNIISEKKISRYPIYDKIKKEYIGYIHIKDIVLRNCERELDFKKYIRPIKFINMNLTLEKALKEFQEYRMQLALVINEKGEISGLLALEDILEELVGEIRDEYETMPEITLNNILNKGIEIIDLKSEDRFPAIEELIGKIYDKKVIINKEIILKKIIDREKSFSTALGHQIAIPHARLEYLKKPVLIIAQSAKGIKFPSPDNMPVKIIFLILTPFNDPSIQLKILSKLSKLISNVTLRKKMLSAKNIETISNIFSTFENKIPD
jgi:CBS domain containing-hemolysin-like protein/mannitol/fructose-specific phosphotransferase system IIA component